MGGIELTATSSGARETSRNVLSGVNVQTAPVHVGNAEYEELTPEDSVNITIGVFFDGTLNNAFNTKARLAYEEAGSKPTSWEGKKYEEVKSKNSEDDTGSYDNDLSNVAIMEAAYLEIKKGKELQTKIYIEGIGTTNYNIDDTDGKGLGEGPTGIKAKVEKACVETAKKIMKLLEKIETKKIKFLRIDVFGFSRGAAAARHFIHVINRKIYEGGGSRKIIAAYGKLGTELKANNIKEPLFLEVRFAGLYETVAAFGIEHVTDTIQLDLDAVSKAKHSFHLVAQDEHRENFVITNIKSAGTKGVEKFIPGVHSDIGGGYTDNYKEDHLVIREGSPDDGGWIEDWSGKKHQFANEFRQLLIRDSWYKPSEIYVNTNILKKEANQHIDPYYAVVINRKVVSKKYSYISLHLMVGYSVKKEIPFDYDVIKEDYSLNEEISVELPNKTIFKTKLSDIKKRLYRHVHHGAEPMRFDNKEDENMIRAIRANCIHTSAHYSGKTYIRGWWYPPHHPYESYITRVREENNG